MSSLSLALLGSERLARPDVGSAPGPQLRRELQAWWPRARTLSVSSHCTSDTQPEGVSFPDSTGMNLSQEHPQTTKTIPAASAQTPLSPPASQPDREAVTDKDEAVSQGS